MKNRTITMRDVADRAGVSQAAVSLALRNHPSLPEATRERLRGLAEEMGYRPNPMISALMAQMRPRKVNIAGATIGVIRNYRRTRGESLWQPGLAERAEELGYKLDHFFAREPDMTGARLSKILRARGIQGLYLPRMPIGHVTLDWRHFTAVTHGYSMIRPRLHRVCANHYEGLLLATRQLKKLGYRRIGLALPADAYQRTNSAWLAGYRVYEEPLPARGRIPVLTSPAVELAAAIPPWLARHRVEALLTMGFDVLGTLGQAGLRVPEDVGVAHLDCTGPTAGELSGIDQQWHAQGRAIIDLLVAMLHRNERGVPEVPRTILVDGVWRDVGTVRKARSGRVKLTV